MADNGPPHGKTARWLTVMAGLCVAIGGLVVSSGDKMSGRGKHGVPPSAQSIHAGYETEDISARDTAAILSAMALTTALAIGIVFVMIWRFNVARHQAFATLTPLQKHHVEPAPPRLEVHPKAVLAHHEAAQQHLLSSYGWVDADHATARIPIARAMALTVGKSLDVQP